MAIILFSRGRRFDPGTGEVSSDGRTCRLEPQPAALLALLSARPGELVTHDEIRQRLWADGRHVEYATSVHYAVRQVRRALDTCDGGSSDIESLPRRGYRLRAEAAAPPTAGREDGAARTDSMPVERGRARGRFGRGLAAAVAIAAAAAAAVAVERQPNRHHETAVALVRAVHDAIY